MSQLYVWWKRCMNWKSYRMFAAAFGSNLIGFSAKKWNVRLKKIYKTAWTLSVFTFLRLFSSCAEKFPFFMKRKASFPVDGVDCSVDFDWLHQSLSGYSGAGDSEVSLSLSPSLWQKLLLNGRVASFSVGVPSGPTGRDNQTGQLQTDRQADRCSSRLKSFLPDSHWGAFRRILDMLFSYKSWIHFCTIRTF